MDPLTPPLLDGGILCPKILKLDTFLPPPLEKYHASANGSTLRNTYAYKDAVVTKNYIRLPAKITHNTQVLETMLTVQEQRLSRGILEGTADTNLCSSTDSRDTTYIAKRLER